MSLDLEKELYSFSQDFRVRYDVSVEFYVKSIKL